MQSMTEEFNPSILEILKMWPQDGKCDRKSLFPGK